MTPFTALSALTSFFTIVKEAAPLVSEIAGDVPAVVADAKKLEQDVAAFDVESSVKDLTALIASVSTPITTMIAVANASKSVVIPTTPATPSKTT
jgi:hypothetical protein